MPTPLQTPAAVHAQARRERLEHAASSRHRARIARDRRTSAGLRPRTAAALRSLADRLDPARGPRTRRSVTA